MNSTLTKPMLEEDTWDHLLHCIDVARQGLECSFDSTLIPLSAKWNGIPNGQKHVCRNQRLLYKWSNIYGHLGMINPFPNRR
jgi:hypothetical protein